MPGLTSCNQKDLSWALSSAYDRNGNQIYIYGSRESLSALCRPEVSEPFVALGSNLIHNVVYIE